jgi:hypothetical protein
MIVSYSHAVGLKDAIEMTLSGNHPCRLCLAIESGKKSEQKQAPALSKLKKDWTLDLSAVAPLPIVPLMVGDQQTPAPHFSFRSERPPLPPPRTTV